MILYFSGTGNSEYAARRIGAAIDDEVCNLFGRLQKQDTTPMYSDKPWVVAAPTYAWRIPRLVSDWLRQTELTGSKDIYFVLTCGGGIGNAGAYLKKLCAAKAMRYQGCAEIVMPENYIAMFGTPEKAEAVQTIRAACAPIDAVSRAIIEGKALAEPKIRILDRVLSGVVNSSFYPMCVSAKKFRVTEKCISCGKCVGLCPMENIQMKDGKPVWGNRCTHCMACICRCPAEAIEYGKHSVGLPRYVFPSDFSEKK